MTSRDALPDSGPDAGTAASDDALESGATAATAVAEPVSAGPDAVAELDALIDAAALDEAGFDESVSGEAEAPGDAEAADVDEAPSVDEGSADGVASSEPSPAADSASDADSEDPEPVTDAAEPDARWADRDRPATALTWLDPTSVAAATGAAAAREDAGPSLLKDAKLRPAVAQARVLVPLSILVGLVAGYAGTTLLWPLHAIAPTVESVTFETTPAPAAAVTWPAQGSAAIGVNGLGVTASTSEADGIASVTKVVTTMMVLDRLPLAVGEQGPEFSFTRADNLEYWNYRRQNQSSLDVPVGGTLTEYQMLQGTLLGSANNYIDRLAREIWGPQSAFADAAETWLSERDLTGITVVTPSGFDERNRATPEALVRLAELAMQNPVFAEIVGTKSVELPGAGRITNTNGMLADRGVVGIKTGTLEHWNLLTAKDVKVGDTTVRLFTAVLGQDGDDERLAATRSLLAETEKALKDQGPAVPAGTVVGKVETAWGASAKIVTDADAEVVLWNSASAAATTSFDIGDARQKGDDVGELTATGPLGSDATKLILADELDDPSPWWRLTHPLELFGIREAEAGD